MILYLLLLEFLFELRSLFICLSLVVVNSMLLLVLIVNFLDDELLDFLSFGELEFGHKGFLSLVLGLLLGGVVRVGIVAALRI